MLKPLQERLQEMITIYKKFEELGIDEHVCEGFKQFKEIANRFVKDGRSESGRIRLKEINRNLVYVLSIQPHVVSSVTLTSL